MPVYKEDNGTFTARFYVKNIDGSRKQEKKRGFKSSREAKAYEIEFLAKKSYSVNMTFKSLYELYIEDMAHRLRENTILTKKSIIEIKILPYFKNRKVRDITPVLIREWQNKMMRLTKDNGEYYAKTYLRTLNNQFSAIMNYAVRYHGLQTNPFLRAGSMGKKNADEMEIWTIEEFETFIKAVDDKPISELGFKVLFWTGARLGELLALTVKDILIDINKIDINKSLQMIRSREVVTEPKTPRSKRRLEVSDELMQELKKYIGMLYCPDENTRLFPFTKQMFERDIKFYAEKAGVKIIRVHDLRHSHASLLLHAGLDIITVSRRLGHENIETTLKTYSHMYNPNAQRVISFLNDLHEKKLPINSKEDII